MTERQSDKNSEANPLYRTDAQLIAWLEQKAKRHGELCDELAAKRLRECGTWNEALVADILAARNHFEAVLLDHEGNPSIQGTSGDLLEIAHGFGALNHALKNAAPQGLTEASVHGPKGNASNPAAAASEAGKDVARDAARWRKWCALNDGCYWDMRRFIHGEESKWHWIPAWKMVDEIDAVLSATSDDGGKHG